MNKKTVLIIVVVIIVVLIVIFVVKPTPTENYIPPQSEHQDTIGSVTFDMVEEDEETSRSSVRITLPKISGLKSKALDDAINSKIKEFVQKTKDDFLNEAETFEIVSSNQKHQLVITGSKPYSLTDSIFSVDVDVYNFYSGAAHPFGYKKIFNFVAETGQSIRIEDILKQNASVKNNITTADEDYSHSLRVVSMAVRPRVIAEMERMLKENQVEDANAEGSFFEEGIAPKLENFDTFLIKKDSVDFVFSQYQVAPYVFGEITVTVPKSELKDALAERSYLK